MTAYYNEIDPFAAKWLRELIAAGHIADGVVDTRSITDVQPSDLVGFTQHHFFAGIGGWSYALRLASWPDDRPVWTGSCPCQPFSAAGRGAGFADERHLWPVWFNLIRKCRPRVIFGEQVASKPGLAWLDLVCTDLEATDHAFAALDLCAAGVGAPHMRQRSYWVAESDGGRRSSRSVQGRREAHEERPRAAAALDRWPSPWGSVDWLACRDGKTRPIEPGLEPLAHGVPARVGRLRGYGNAIVPEVAAVFISAYLDYQDLDTL